MGLSFHFSGRLAKPEHLPELIDEVCEIAKINHWEYHIFERQFTENTFGKSEYNQNIYGISFTPPGCETVPICFLSNGRMSSFLHLEFHGETAQQPESNYLYMLAVKTQYAGMGTHLFIIQLFRYLNTKYFADFNLTDEGGYWETNDIEVLKANFKKYDAIMSGFSSALECIPMKPEELLEEYFDRLIKVVQKRIK